jgi:hypothetical protein
LGPVDDGRGRWSGNLRSPASPQGPARPPACVTRCTVPNIAGCLAVSPFAPAFKLPVSQHEARLRERHDPLRSQQRRGSRSSASAPSTTASAPGRGPRKGIGSIPSPSRPATVTCSSCRAASRREEASPQGARRRHHRPGARSGDQHQRTPVRRVATSRRPCGRRSGSSRRSSPAPDPAAAPRP